MALCNTCAKLDITKLKIQPYVTPTIYDLSTVEEAHKRGCVFCSLLWESATMMADAYQKLQPENTWQGDIIHTFPWLRIGTMSDNGDGYFPRLNRLRITLNKTKPISTHTIKLSPNNITQEVVEFELCLAAGPDSQAYQSGAIGGVYLGSDRRSSKYLEALKQHLQQCLENKAAHAACHKSLTTISLPDPYSSPLPTRCLEISENSVCLTHTMNLRGQYATLSHRWHQDTPKSNTTVENYRHRLNGEVRDLDMNFHDAVTVARGLKIRYLWIDTVCIIQNKKSDWLTESAKMGEYYQNSLFTIAALHKSESTGFLDVKQPRMESIARLPFFENGTRNGNVYAYRRPQRLDTTFLREVDHSELLSRGWVFQEHALSRRIIYFSEQETFIECSTSFPKSMTGHTLYVQPTDTIPGSDIDLAVRGDYNRLKHGLKCQVSNFARKPYDQWYNCATGYSCTILTVIEDHNFAIAGVASEFMELLANTREDFSGNLPLYLAGLWLNDIHHGLLWQSGAQYIVPCSCGAPSWSWMSVSSPVQWRTRHKYTQSRIQVIKVSQNEIEAASNSPTSEKCEVTQMSKSLTLRGRHIQVLIKDDDEYEKLRQKTGEQLDSGTYHAIFRTQAAEEPVGWASMDQPQKDRHPATRSHPFTAVVLHVATRRFVRNLQPQVYDVILLQRTSNDKYRRIGVGSLFGRVILKELRKQPLQNICLE